MKSLLALLNIEQIDALIQEEELKSIGYKFFFIIDSHDLKNYTYPFELEGNRIEVEKISYNYITDEQIALYSLFNKHDFKAFILDEHFDEIATLIDTVKFFQLKGIKVIDNVERFAKKLKERTSIELSEFVDNIKVMKENISLILCIAVGLLADGVEKLYKLQSENKLLIDLDDIYELFNDKLIIESIDHSKFYSSLTDLIFNMVSKNLKEDEQKPFKIFQRRISYYRDSQAIDRVLKINELLHENNRKQIFLLLSSDNKTRKLFYRKNYVNQLIQNRLIEVNGQKINYLRQCSQIFLRLLCEEDDTSKIIKNLNSVNKLVEARWEVNESTNDILKFLNDRYDRCKKEFENYATFLRIDEFQKLNEDLKKKDLTNYNDIPKILDKIIATKRNSESELRKNINELLRQLDELHIFRDVISNNLNLIIRNNVINKGYQTESGKDYVFGKDHHLPTIFHSPENNHLDLSFTKIADHYNDSQVILYEFLEETIIKLFATFKDSDELILKRCQILLMLHNKNIDNFTPIQFTTNYSFNDPLAKLDFDYLYCWALRREEKYTEAIEIAQNVIKNIQHKEEPRFHHSLSLCFYCQFELDSTNSNLTLLEKSLEHLIVARIGYEKLAKVSQGHKLKYVNKNIYATYNTEIYIKSLIFSKKDGVPNYILDGRSLLKKLKLIDIEYDNKPEFLHTESFLELQEYRVLNDKQKLNYAFEAITTALRLEEIGIFIPIKLKQLCIRLRDELTDLIQI